VYLSRVRMCGFQNRSSDNDEGQIFHPCLEFNLNRPFYSVVFLKDLNDGSLDYAKRAN